jgi:hypothetical protein
MDGLKTGGKLGDLSQTSIFNLLLFFGDLTGSRHLLEIFGGDRAFLPHQSKTT